MYIADVMTTEIVAVSHDTSIETAVRTLSKHRVSGAPVIGEEGTAVGVISLWDLVDPERFASGAQGTSFFYKITSSECKKFEDTSYGSQGCVSDIMSANIVAIDSSAPVVEGAKTLIAKEIHRLLVIDQGKLVGIVSSLDLLQGLVREVM